MTGTEDLPTLRQTLEVLQQQHAALNAEERMLESKVGVGVMAVGRRRRERRDSHTAHSVHPTLPTDRKEEGGAGTQRGPAQELADRTVRLCFLSERIRAIP